MYTRGSVMCDTTSKYTDISLTTPLILYKVSKRVIYYLIVQQVLTLSHCDSQTEWDICIFFNLACSDDRTMSPPNLVHISPCPFQNTYAIFGAPPTNRRKSLASSLITQPHMYRLSWNFICKFTSSYIKDGWQRVKMRFLALLLNDAQHWATLASKQSKISEFF